MRASRPEFLAGAWALALGAFVVPQAQAQDPVKIAFDTDLPRILVFIQERDGQIAAREMTNFFLDAGFPVVDPALAVSAARRELVREALAGDEGAATALGRDFGAQVLVLGQADWGARPDPFDQSAITATGEIAVRALRLDLGRVVATAEGDGGRVLEATEQRGRARALRRAASQILQESRFLGQLMNNWDDEPWREALYWVPDPGSVPASLSSSDDGGGPRVAILRTAVAPASQIATRGFGVVEKGDRSSALFNAVRLEGVVVGAFKKVEVEGKPANMEPLQEGEAERLGIDGADAQRFWAETSLPMSQDTVAVVATGPRGKAAKAVAAPWIDERWAVVIGIGQYASDDIPDLAFARADAQGVYDFLRSSAAGPFEEDHILFLADEEATGAAMREAMFVFLQQADWDDLVVIYYAGHGTPDANRPDNLYLLPHDTDLNAMAGTAFPMWDVKTALRRQIKAERVIVIADACHSAGTYKDEVPEIWGGENAIAGGFTQLFTPSRRLSMTAADTNEFSLEDARWNGHGVFTYFLLQALDGLGDANGDGIVTFSEAFDFVSDSVVDNTQGRQNPQRSGQGDIPMAVVEGN